LNSQIKADLRKKNNPGRVKDKDEKIDTKQSYKLLEMLETTNKSKKNVSFPKDNKEDNSIFVDDLMNSTGTFADHNDYNSHNNTKNSNVSK